MARKMQMEKPSPEVRDCDAPLGLDDPAPVLVWRCRKEDNPGWSLVRDTNTFEGKRRFIACWPTSADAERAGLNNPFRAVLDEVIAEARRLNKYGVALLDGDLRIIG